MQNSHSRGSPCSGQTSDSEQVYVVFAVNDSDGEFAKCILRHDRCTRVLKTNESMKKTVAVKPARRLPSIDVLPLPFDGVDKFGDIEWMRSQSEYKSYLYVVPDNPQIPNGPVFFTRLRNQPDCVPIEYKHDRTESEQPMKRALTEIEAKLRANGQYTTVCYPADRSANLYAQRVDIPSEDTRNFPRRLQALVKRINAGRGHGDVELVSVSNSSS
eukprot:g28984.t1